jgi:gas vesicle protein
MVVSGTAVGGRGSGCKVASDVTGVGVGACGVGEAGALVQAPNRTSKTRIDTLANRRKMWNMLAANGVMVISAPIIAQAHTGKSLIRDGQLVL